MQSKNSPEETSELEQIEAIRAFAEQSCAQFASHLAYVCHLLLKDPSNFSNEGLLDLYSSAGASHWVMWRLNKLARIYPNVAEEVENKQIQLDNLIMQLQALEVTLEGFAKNLESIFNPFIEAWSLKLQKILKSEDVEEGDFAFEKILIDRDKLSFAVDFLRIRQQYEMNLPFTLPIDKTTRTILLAELPLKLNYEVLAKRFHYKELSWVSPEHFWWRKAYEPFSGQLFARKQ